MYKSPKDFNLTDYYNTRSKLYGGGFSWALNLDELQLKTQAALRDRDVIKNNIVNRRYDVVILGSGHCDGWASKLHFFFDVVCKHYQPSEVGFVFGADFHFNKKILKKYAPCVGHFFSREGYA